MAMLNKTRKFFVRLHEDETGPNTVEWILLIIVGLIILIGIFLFARWAVGRMGQNQTAAEEQTGLLEGERNNLGP
ncbi:MAG: hypothetical protein SFZ24_10385 [Planctomycetota bacterium]|nr:hypothetical protein [Planctomycetota bacterium]